jgi:hypothetical protein
MNATSPLPEASQPNVTFLNAKVSYRSTPSLGESSQYSCDARKNSSETEGLTARAVWLLSGALKVETKKKDEVNNHKFSRARLSRSYWEKTSQEEEK